MNEQFSSVLTQEDVVNFPDMGTPPYATIQTLTVRLAGVATQLKMLNPHKAGGADDVLARVLSDYADSLAPILTFIYQQTLDRSTLPSDWRKAVVTPIYKKGSSQHQKTTGL